MWEVWYHIKGITSMIEVYLKDAVVFEVCTCIKTCGRQQWSWLITTNYLNALSFVICCLSHAGILRSCLSLAALLQPPSLQELWLEKSYEHKDRLIMFWTLIISQVCSFVVGNISLLKLLFVWHNWQNFVSYPWESTKNFDNKNFQIYGIKWKLNVHMATRTVVTLSIWWPLFFQFYFF